MIRFEKKEVFFSLSSTNGNNFKTLGISIIIIPNKEVVKEKLHSEKSCILICQIAFWHITQRLNLFPENLMKKVSWKCIKAHMWCTLQYGAICLYKT